MTLESKLEQPSKDHPASPTLEANVSTTSPSPQITNHMPSPLVHYLIDTTASWTFYIPLMASIEYGIAGMEPEKVLKSRLISMAAHALIARPYGKFREYYAQIWQADPASSQLKKVVVDTSATILFQAPVYSTLLYLAGASFKQGVIALTTGLAVGAASGRLYGFYLDYWRKKWGGKPTLSK